MVNWVKTLRWANETWIKEQRMLQVIIHSPPANNRNLCPLWGSPFDPAPAWCTAPGTASMQAAPPGEWKEQWLRGFRTTTTSVLVMCHVQWSLLRSILKLLKHFREILWQHESWICWLEDSRISRIRCLACSLSSLACSVNRIAMTILQALQVFGQWLGSQILCGSSGTFLFLICLNASNRLHHW